MLSVVLSLAVLLFVPFAVLKSVRITTLVHNNTKITAQVLVKVNTSASLVHYEYKETDASLKSWSILYEENIQIFKSVTLGELELSQPKSLSICFVAYIDTNELVSLKTVDLLNQTFTEQVLYPDVLLKERVSVFDRMVLKERLIDFGDKVVDVCRRADAVYTSDFDVLKLVDYHRNEKLKTSTKMQPHLKITQYPYCFNAPPGWELGCLCHNSVFIHWYPCKSKTCYENNDLSNDEDALMDSCGMESCRQKRQLVYFVDNSKLCIPS